MALDPENPNVQPQLTAREIPTSYREPAVTSSMPNILSPFETRNSTTNIAIIPERKKKQTAVNYEVIPENIILRRKNVFEHGSAFNYLAPNESSGAPAYLGLAESYPRQMPIRSKETNHTFGYLLPNEFRHEYLDLVDYNPIHSSVMSSNTEGKSAYLVPNKFKLPSRVHDYLDLVDYPTLPHGRPHDPDSKCRYLLPNTRFRYLTRRHDYLDLIDYDPSHSLLRRRHSDPFSGYLVPNEFRQQVYTNDYMHLAERDLDRPTVYAFLRRI